MTNSLATFQTMINDIFRDLIAEGIMVVYLNDILIFTQTKKEHTKAIQQVLQILQKNKLFLHSEKCEFCKEQIEYLDLVILENKVSMDLVKVARVQKWSIPENKTNIQAFLGFVNFYWRFIWDFSAKAWPLFDQDMLWTSLDIEWKRAGSLWGPQNSSDHCSSINVPSGLGAFLDWSR